MVRSASASLGLQWAISEAQYGFVGLIDELLHSVVLVLNRQWAVYSLSAGFLLVRTTFILGLVGVPERCCARLSASD